jgi:hypothetical protein
MTHPPRPTQLLERRDLLRGLCALALGSLPSACSDDPTPRVDLSLPDAPIAETRWLELYGHLCLLHLPASAIAARPAPRPLLIALHDLGETPPSSLDRWRTAADAAGFVLLCANWTAEPVDARDRLLDHFFRIVEELDRTQPIDSSHVCLATRGAATPLGYRGAFERHSGRWAAVSFLGGVPDGDWGSSPAAALAGLVDSPPALHYSFAETGLEAAAAKACAAALSGRGVVVEQAPFSGTLAISFDAAKVWAWLASRLAKSP